MMRTLLCQLLIISIILMLVWRPKAKESKSLNMTRLDGDTSNELFKVLAEWNTYLELRKSDDFSVPPCP